MASEKMIARVSEYLIGKRRLLLLTAIITMIVLGLLILLREGPGSAPFIYTNF